VLVATRAADTEADLAWAAWQAQPPLYQRGGGSEIPYSDLWGAEARATADTGTWELLLQAARGRYLQIRLTLRGNGRSTPLLRALRAHYPRYSYLREYLPAVYQQDAGSQQFVENFLANPEGIFTTVEGLIAQVQTLMDVRTVPAEAVTWLASWLGLALEPGWSDYQRRLLLAHAPAFFQRRGTLPGLLQAILLTVYPQLGPDIFRDDVDLRCTTIRIVERFLTRTQPAVSAGDPTEPAPTGGDDVVAEAAARAHRFTVMLPTEIDSSTQRLVERIVALEKPAHTSFTVKQYWALFRVGEVRLGLDTVLGRGGRFETFRLGETALAEGTLGAAFPYSLTTRTVIAR
jgi:phage tail-like protein